MVPSLPRMDAAPAPPQAAPPRDSRAEEVSRDEAFLGLHRAPPGRFGEDFLRNLDPYGTLGEKQWSPSMPWLLRQLEDAEAGLLAACPSAKDAALMHAIPGLNPPSWSLGHVAFTFESIVGRPLCLPPRALRTDAWRLYDSMRVTNAERWQLLAANKLPGLREAMEYLHRVHEQAATLLKTHAAGSPSHEGEPSVTDGAAIIDIHPVLSYLVLYAIIHELWHTEDLIHTRNTLGLAHPGQPLDGASRRRDAGQDVVPPSPHADVFIPGGEFYLGAQEQGCRMVFDCEKWEHAVEVPPFRISRDCVTNAEYQRFVEAGGYKELKWWSHEGQKWLALSGATCPWAWGLRMSDGDERRWILHWFDTELELPLGWPVSHVNWYEAEAFCCWAGRRLPTEAEWELACCGEPDGCGGIEPHKSRQMPWGGRWGQEPIRSEQANCGSRRAVLLDAADLPASESAWGCRQMVGNVWEWTATTLYPYPGFIMDYPYREQSAPWFGTNKVARGGCFATPDLVVRGDYRSFYHPTERPEVCVGFRTCALSVVKE